MGDDNVGETLAKDTGKARTNLPCQPFVQVPTAGDLELDLEIRAFRDLLNKDDSQWLYVILYR